MSLFFKVKAYVVWERQTGGNEDRQPYGHITSSFDHTTLCYLHSSYPFLRVYSTRGYLKATVPHRPWFCDYRQLDSCDWRLTAARPPIFHVGIWIYHFSAPTYFHLITWLLPLISRMYIKVRPTITLFTKPEHQAVRSQYATKGNDKYCLSLGYIYIYIYIIYCHPQTDCFMVSQHFSVAREARFPKLGSKPVHIHTHVYIYIYIYICMCVCVCVYVCVHRAQWVNYRLNYAKWKENWHLIWLDIFTKMSRKYLWIL